MSSTHIESVAPPERRATPSINPWSRPQRNGGLAFHSTRNSASRIPRASRVGVTRPRAMEAHVKDELLTTAAAARRLGVQPQTIRQMLKDGRLSGVRAGNRLRVHSESVEAFIERHQTDGPHQSRDTKLDTMVSLMRALLSDVRAIRHSLDGEAS